MKNQIKSFRNRKNLRLKHYDYANDGAYFVTICANNRECLFGDIVDGQMHLNDAGLMIENLYQDLENKFANIQCGEYVIMPNHFHCVIHIQNDDIKQNVESVQNNVGVVSCANPLLGQQQGIAPTKLSNIVGAFKSLTTNAYINGVKTKNWQPFDKRLWQRNYYEHIIRTEKSYNEIIRYIVDNPLKWELDQLNPNFENNKCNQR